MTVACKCEQCGYTVELEVKGYPDIEIIHNDGNHLLSAIGPGELQITNLTAQIKESV